MMFKMRQLDSELSILKNVPLSLCDNKSVLSEYVSFSYKSPCFVQRDTALGTVPSVFVIYCMK